MIIFTSNTTEQRSLNSLCIRFICCSMMMLSILLFTITAATAATIGLKSGTSVKGKLISRTEDEVTIQDVQTRQLRSIKSVFIRDIVLDPGEEQPEKTVKVGRDIKLRGGSTEKAGDGKRHFMFALGGAGCKIIDGPGTSLNFGGGGTFIFQYNYLYMGLGVDLHAAYYYNPDKKYTKDFINILPVIVSPMYKFNTKYIDIDLRAGIGFSWSRAKSAQRFQPFPTGDPGQPLAGFVTEGINDSTVDLAVGAGVGISHVFNMGVVLGFEVNYYYIFQTLSANTIAASIYMGYMF
jgi:hypothetical protein